ncbi:hypothetical protein SEA_BABYDOTZ_82 [Microbacterium phage BabyDotz]|nr:hypothetical protein SEA_BABYDOTZ_82 [Microbacterium phage BabyDotz]
MSDQIPMRSASERRDAAKPVLMWLGVYADRAREIVTEIEESREADGLEQVIEARDAADDHLSHYVQHIEKQRAVLEALLEVPEVGLTEDEIVKGAIDRASWHITAGDGVTFSYVNLVAMLTDAVRTAERAALEHWEPADIPSQEFMLRHLGIENELDPAVGMVFIREQYIEKEVI